MALLSITSALALAVPLTLLASGDVQAAEKKVTLMDLLFKRERQKPVVQSAPAVPKRAVQQPVRRAAPVVTGPQFLTYRADAPVRIDVLKNIKPASAASEAGLGLGALSAGLTFPEALSATDSLSLFNDQPVLDAIVKHYGSTPKFLWIDGFGISGKAERVLAVLEDAEAYGLDALDYAVARPDPRWSPDRIAERNADLLRFELELSAAALRYIRDVEGRRIDPNRISGYHDLKDKTPDLAASLALLGLSIDPAAHLTGLHPDEPAYQALVDALATVRESASTTQTIPPQTLIRPGDATQHFAAFLRRIADDADTAFLAEHGAQLASAVSSASYAPDLVPLVKAWQAHKGLGADGIIGPRTIAATMGLPRETKIERIELALERMRWLPDRYGERHVFINQPAFTASYFEDGAAELSMNVVVGKASNQTFFFHDKIEYVEFNPTWGMPRSILVNQYLPKLRANPGYLDANGYEVFTSSGKRVSSSSVNWSALGSNPGYYVRQPAGPDNALGELKIMFPNKHAIYLHDTPAKSLFARASRAFSSGCVRLEDPRGMAAAVLGVEREDLSPLLARGTRRENLKQQVPVYLTYMTAWPNQVTGEIEYFDDMYQRDVYLLKAIEATRAARRAQS